MWISCSKVIGYIKLLGNVSEERSEKFLRQYHSRPNYGSNPFGPSSQVHMQPSNRNDQRKFTLKMFIKHKSALAHKKWQSDLKMTHHRKLLSLSLSPPLPWEITRNQVVGDSEVSPPPISSWEPGICTEIRSPHEEWVQVCQSVRSLWSSFASVAPLIAGCRPWTAWRHKWLSASTLSFWVRVDKYKLGPEKKAKDWEWRCQLLRRKVTHLRKIHSD